MYHTALNDVSVLYETIIFWPRKHPNYTYLLNKTSCKPKHIQGPTIRSWPVGLSSVSPQYLAHPKVRLNRDIKQMRSISVPLSL